jgi:hypoxanthine phosphoribosyltransferase
MQINPTGRNHRVLYSAEQVRQVIDGMAAAISRDFAGQPIKLIGVLKGAAYLLIHLQSAIERIGLVTACYVDYVRVSSYGSGQISGELQLIIPLRESVADQNVIIIEDVADSLKTLGFLWEYLYTNRLSYQRPKTLKIAVLLEKPEKHVRTDVPLDYVGISEVGVGFVYGCGMDVAEQFRGLDYIAVMDEGETTAE